MLAAMRHDVFFDDQDVCLWKVMLGKSHADVVPEWATNLAEQISAAEFWFMEVLIADDAS